MQTWPIWAASKSAIDINQLTMKKKTAWAVIDDRLSLTTAHRHRFFCLESPQSLLLERIKLQSILRELPCFWVPPNEAVELTLRDADVRPCLLKEAADWIWWIKPEDKFSTEPTVVHFIATGSLIFKTCFTIRLFPQHLGKIFSTLDILKMDGEGFAFEILGFWVF